MQVTGMLYGAKLLQFAGFPAAEVLGPDASEEQIKALIERHGSVFVKPVFKGGVGKKGKAGLLGRAKDLKTALKEKERLYFVEHRHGNQTAKANGVTFEGAVPAEHEVYFSITDSTRFRAPTMTLTHHGGMDIEELDKSLVANVPFDPLTGLKAFVVANALSELNAPKELISPLVQQLPKLWELYHNFGMTTLELNPIRMRPDRQGRLTPVACDFKCGFDRGDPRWQRLDLPAHLFAVDYSDFEQEINQLRTYQAPERRLRHQRAGHDPGADVWRWRQFAGDRDARRRRYHFLRLRWQSTIRKDEGSGPHLLQALAQAGQRAVHHRREIQQHRHLRDISRDGGRSARALQRARPTPVFVDRPWRPSNPVRGMSAAARHHGGVGAPLPHLWIRF